MSKPHWTHPAGGHGCQFSDCADRAAFQWRRSATDAEIQHELNLQGPYGAVHRNPEGPHAVAVFACETHVCKRFINDTQEHDLDSMALLHRHDCPSPDAGCECE